MQGESDEDVTVWLTETEKWTGFGALDGTDTETSAGGEQSRDRVHGGFDDIGECGPAQRQEMMG